MKHIPVAGESGVISFPVAGIAATPSPLVLAASDTAQITVHGLRGSLAPTIDITQDCTFTIMSGGDADITVSNSAGTKGLITIAGSATEDDSAVIEVKYMSGSKEYSDTVYVSIA